jgi:hypothetical protein
LRAAANSVSASFLKLPNSFPLKISVLSDSVQLYLSYLKFSFESLTPQLSHLQLTQSFTLLFAEYSVIFLKLLEIFFQRDHLIRDVFFFNFQIFDPTLPLSKLILPMVNPSYLAAAFINPINHVHRGFSMALLFERCELDIISL